jgi:hypothetical protein
LDKSFEKFRELDEIVWQNTDAQGKKLVLRLHHRGRWKIDNELGKATLVIEIHNMEAGTYETYAPAHEDIDMMLEAMFRVELENDNYVFKGGGKRPPQMRQKLQRTKEVVSRWEREMWRRRLGK